MKQKNEITVVTPQVLSATQKKNLETVLTQKLGVVTPKYLVDPAIVGGLKININGQELDGTLLGEVQRLRSQLPVVTITTAVELTAAEQTQIENIVDKKIGSAEYKITVDPNVLGGIKIVLGSEAFDGTLKGKLQTLRQVLLKKVAS
ncbi:MAG: F0F1 ATP synthase subunit delta [bacterium]|nr:F0F1 ATP synthase subunit delta [bacterium]